MIKLLKSPELNQRRQNQYFEWNKCKLETVIWTWYYYNTITGRDCLCILNHGGKLIRPNLIKGTSEANFERTVSKTSKQINDILRKVVTGEEGTASLADVFGYNVGGKTGTSENYLNKKKI